jgi:flagellar biosynthetic protein FlhB
VLAVSQQGGSALGALREMMRRGLLAASADDLTPGQVAGLMRAALADSLAVVAPILMVTALVGVAATATQIGFHVFPKRLLPDGSKISPAAGFARIVSKRGAVDLLKAILKIVLVGWISWKIIVAAADVIVPLAESAPREILTVTGTVLERLVAWSVGALAVLAAADYAWQRRQHSQSLRMTRTQVKEERRQSEGDPQIKARVRRAYQQIAKRRMLDDVPTAQVVVTNPVHLAVALRYVHGETRAPVVVAKGAEHVAERIKEIARRHGVPIVERRALARALFRGVPIGGEIPATLYRAVAEILAYIFGLQARRVG